MSDCPEQEGNLKNCNCSYSGCARQGKCCECLRYHLSNQQLPACCFPDDVEKSWDRSFKNFVNVCRDRYGY